MARITANANPGSYTVPTSTLFVGREAVLTGSTKERSLSSYATIACGLLTDSVNWLHERTDGRVQREFLCRHPEQVADGNVARVETCFDRHVPVLLVAYPGPPEEIITVHVTRDADEERVAVDDCYRG